MVLGCDKIPTKKIIHFKLLRCLEESLPLQFFRKHESQVILIGSMTDLQLRPDAATFLNYEEPKLATRIEGMDGRIDNGDHRTDWLDTAWQLEFENSRMELSNGVEGGEAHLKNNLNLTT